MKKAGKPWECRLRRPGSIPLRGTGPVVPAHSGNDPSLSSQGRRCAPSLPQGEPWGQGKATPCPGQPPCGARKREFHQCRPQACNGLVVYVFSFFICATPVIFASSGTVT